MKNSGQPYVAVGFGDSIVKGMGASTPDRCWLAVLESLMTRFMDRPLTMINSGIGDNTISPRTTNYELACRPSALERIDRDLLAHRPDLALICFGLNDMRFGTPIEIFIADLDQVVVKVRKALGATSILLANVYHITGFKLYEPRNKGSIAAAKLYNEHISQLARIRQCMLADVSGAMAFNDRLICSDGIHANDLGHHVIAQRVFETLVAGLEIFVSGEKSALAAS